MSMYSACVLNTSPSASSLNLRYVVLGFFSGCWEASHTLFIWTVCAMHRNVPLQWVCVHTVGCNRLASAGQITHLLA